MNGLRTAAAILAATWLAGSVGCVQLSTEMAVANAPAPAPAFESKVAFGKLYERQGDTTKAQELYRAALKRNPNDVNALHRLAVVAARTGNYDESDAYFERAYTLSPNDSVLMSDFGYAVSLQRRLEEAEFLLEKSLALDPQNSAARNNLALVVGLQGRLNASMAIFRQTGSEAQAHANLGFVHVQRGEFDLAVSHYNQALSLDNDLRPAAEALIQLAQFQQNANRTSVASSTSAVRPVGATTEQR